MDKGSEIKVGDTVTHKSEGPDWVAVVDEIYTENGGWDWLAEVTYMDGFDTIDEVIPLEDLELFHHNDYSSEEDNVNSPSHYGAGKIECIEYLEDFLTNEEFIGYLRGNIGKYLHRWRYKNGLEDLKKAQWYLNKLIEKVEENGV